MEAKELMIGDWAYIKDYPMMRYAERMTANHFVRSLCEFEPIPITEEMLKANGFRCVNENSAYTLMVMSDDGYTIEVYICIANCVFNVEHNYTLNKERVMNRAHKCGYFVHELQHALRSCGLNDLADNFKVK